MARGRLFRTGMLERLLKFMPATCTLQSATLTRDGYGEPAAAWADEAELADLPGQLSPASEAELRLLGLSIEKTTHVLGLAGHYPAITPDMRVLVDQGDGLYVAYAIQGVRHDSAGLRTYLGVSRVVASAGDVA